MNDASSFFNTDFEKCLNYTSSSMEANFSKKYSVIAQDKQNALSGFYIWSLNGDYKAMGEKCDTLFPNRSYLAIANSNDSTQIQRFFISKAG